MPQPTDLVETDLSISDSYWRLLELRSQYPGGKLIRIRPDWREQSPPSGPAAELFRAHVVPARSVLDVGAGNRYWKSVLERLGFDGEYASADVEDRHRHEYRDFLSVDVSFDAILLLEVIEHVPLADGLRFVEHAARRLNPNGVLVVGTPNPRHAHRFWSSDVTHVRPWPDHDLWALCRLLGLDDVTVYRQMLVPPRRRLALPLQLMLSKILELDPVHGLLVFARKKAEDSP